MLQPKKQKYRKQQKGRSRKRMKETRGTSLAFGSVGLQSLSSDWVTSNQLEAGRKAITRHLKREGKLWIRVFPDKPVTKFPPEVTMGGGKGEVDRFVSVVKPGRIIFEVGGVDEELASRALKLAGYKLPLKTRVVTKN